jgi:vacuolar protein sorting-associated protein 8
VTATPTTKLNGHGYLSPARAYSPSRRFDIRQHQRLSSYSSLVTGYTSPSIHSRVSSFSSNVADVNEITRDDTPNVPWEVVRWTNLRKIEGQAFSEIGKRKFGTPTVLAVSTPLYPV